MKGSWFQRFSEGHLLPHLQGFAAKGKFLFKVPVGAVYRGFIFDSSGFSKESFYPQVYVQPLYVPCSHVVLTFGERFIGSWAATEVEERQLGTKLLECIRSVGLPFLEALGTPERLAHPPSPWKDSPNVRIQEVIAYSLAMVGENDRAIEGFEKICNQIQASSDKRDWVMQLFDELQGLKTLLRKDPARARNQLAAWTEETRKNLRLPE
jgi:hypothetical protein